MKWLFGILCKCICFEPFSECDLQLEHYTHFGLASFTTIHDVAVKRRECE